MHVYYTDRPAQEAGQALDTLLRRHRSVPTLLMCSGGSALSLLAHISEEALGAHMTVTVLDERYSIEPDENNFAQLAQLPFYARAQEAGASFIDTRVREGETSEALARRFSDALSGWRTDHPDGAVIVTQGIGTDGHTAGILPFSDDPQRFTELFEETEQPAVHYRVAPEKNEHTERVTTTYPFLREKVDESIVYAAGAEKQDALNAVCAYNGALHRTPARIIHEMNNVQLFTDQNVVGYQDT